MEKKIKKIVNLTQNYFAKNIAGILSSFFVFLVLNYLLTLPYINLISSFFGYFPHIIALVTLIYFLKPKSSIILKISLLFIISSYPFLLFNFQKESELIGVIAYFLLVIYIFSNIKELFFQTK